MNFSCDHVEDGNEALVMMIMMAMVMMIMMMIIMIIMMPMMMMVMAMVKMMIMIAMVMILMVMMLKVKIRILLVLFKPFSPPHYFFLIVIIPKHTPKNIQKIIRYIFHRSLLNKIKQKRE